MVRFVLDGGEEVLISSGIVDGGSGLYRTDREEAS
jgi:hypothetical protein